MAVREFWLKLILRGENPSDAICVQAEETDTTISDLKRRFLQEVREILPGQTALPWITLTLPPSPFSSMDGLDVIQTLDSSQELSELPEGAGSKKWQLHAEVRLLGDMGPPVDRTQSPQVQGNRGGGEGRTLYERGIAGREEPDHIKNAVMVAGPPLAVQQQIVQHQLAAHQQLAAHHPLPPQHQMLPQQQQMAMTAQQPMAPQQMTAQQLAGQSQLTAAQQANADQTQKWIEQQTSRWTEQQGLLLVEARRMEDEKNREQGFRGRSVAASDKWQSIADHLVSQGVAKTREQCRQKWENLMRDFKKIKDYRTPNGNNDYWAMDAVVRKDKKLPGQFSERIYEAMDQFLSERNMSVALRDSEMRWNPPEDGEEEGGSNTPAPNFSARKKKWQSATDDGTDESLADFIRSQADESRKLQVELAKASWEKMDKYMKASYRSAEQIVETLDRLTATLQSRVPHHTTPTNQPPQQPSSQHLEHAT